MLLPDTSLFPFHVGLGQNKDIRDLKPSKAQLKVPQNIACAEGMFPTASSLLSTDFILSYLEYTLGRISTCGCVALGVGHLVTCLQGRNQPLLQGHNLYVNWKLYTTPWNYRSNLH